jgi:hypothetical protein
MLTIPPDLDFESSSTTTNQYFEAFPLQLSHICGAFQKRLQTGDACLAKTPSLMNDQLPVQLSATLTSAPDFGRAGTINGNTGCEVHDKGPARATAHIYTI